MTRLLAGLGYERSNVLATLIGHYDPPRNRGCRGGVYVVSASEAVRLVYEALFMRIDRLSAEEDDVRRAHAQAVRAEWETDVSTFDEDA